MLRSSRPEVFCKKGVLKDFAEFIGKQLYWSLFFYKDAGQLEKRVAAHMFPIKFAKFLRTSF